MNQLCGTQNHSPKPDEEALRGTPEVQTHCLFQHPYVLSSEVSNETSSWRERKEMDPGTIPLAGLQMATKNNSQTFPSLFNIKVPVSRWLNATLQIKYHLLFTCSLF